MFEDKDGDKCMFGDIRFGMNVLLPSKIEAKIRVPPGIKNGDVVRFQGPYGGLYTLVIKRDGSRIIICRNYW